MNQKLLEIIELKKSFGARSGFFQGNDNVVRAVDGVTLQVKRAETLGLVGESGCGKSTLARLIVRLDEPTEGSILFDNEDIFKLKGARLKEYRRSVQMIFQDPYSSLNPRRTAGDIIEEPLKIHNLSAKGEGGRKLREMAQLVGLNEEQLKRYPHEFSGGQRQRIGIARALILRPRLIIADEPVSSLDLSVQAQILNLLKSLQNELELTYLFITHDFGVVQHMSDRIAVMYLGKIVELGATAQVCEAPVHPYTQALISAVPEIDPAKNIRKSAATADFDSTHIYSNGCSFFPRCPCREDICAKQSPILEECGPEHRAACHKTDKKKLAFAKKRC